MLKSKNSAVEHLPLRVAFIMGWRLGRFGEKRMSQGQTGAEQRLVTPGMVIGPSAGKRAGSGIVTAEESMIATQLGWLREQNNTVSIDPINAAYMPRSGDLVVATVAEVRNNLWFMNINGAFQGLLPMSLAPWKVEFGAARQHMDVGNVVLARVQEVDECHNVVLTMKGVGLRRLNQGTVESIPVQHIDRVRGDNNSLLQRMREACDCRIMVGENGRVWIDGDADGIAWARMALQMVAEHGHSKAFETILSEMEQITKGDA
jgi:exosome complex component RRP4